MDETIEKLLRDYRWTLNRKINHIRLNTYADAQAFAKLAGNNLRIVLNPTDIVGMDEDQLTAVLNPLLKEMSTQVGNAVAIVQKKINRSAGIGLNALVPEYSPETARSVARNIVSGMETAEALKDLPEVGKQIVNEAMKVVDEGLRMNAEAHYRSGLETKIIRRYDDVGVHNRKDPCEWCLSRAGEYSSYMDAYNAGVFERHPGCGCTVEYHVGKTHSFRDASGAWNNL